MFFFLFLFGPDHLATEQNRPFKNQILVYGPDHSNFELNSRILDGIRFQEIGFQAPTVI